LREHRAGYRFRPPSCPFVEPAALLLARCPGPTVQLRNPSKSTLAHDAVAAVVLHKHHLIIRVGAGLIQLVYGSHSRMAADLTLDKNLFSQPFSRVLRHGVEGVLKVNVDPINSLALSPSFLLDEVNLLHFNADATSLPACTLPWF